MNKQTTDPQGELLTLVDEKNQVIGSIPRGEAHNKIGVYYRTIYVLVMNAKNQVLIQRRSSTKDLYPNCWDISVGGHVNYGDSYEKTAARELGEELAVSVSESELIDKGEVLVKLPKSNEYFRVFEYKLKPTDEISALEEEISDTDWMTIDDIKKSIKDESLPWYARPKQVIAALY